MNRSLTNFLVFLLLIVLLQSSVIAQNSLDVLYQNKQYFDLRDELAKHSKGKSTELLFYRGVIANRFNQNQKAISLFQQYLQKRDPEKSVEAYEELADSYSKIGQYQEAAATYKILFDRFADKVSAEKISDYKNSYELWNALKSILPQKVLISRDVKLQGKRDKADLLNLAVGINGQPMDLVFDTGANLSVITASTAKKLGLKIIESSVSVGSSTDVNVNSKLAVADINLGDAIIKHSVFLVVEDKSMYFPQIDYQIHGILGFPVIEALGNFSITRKDEFFVSSKQVNYKAEQNLCLDGLLPLVTGVYKDRRMVFSLDSGADGSTFYRSFFKADEQNIVKSARTEKIRLGGSGGSKDMNAYIFEGLQLNIANKNVRFKKAAIITEPLNEQSKYLYGNLGQDLIRQFAKMTMDLRSMRVVFE